MGIVGLFTIALVGGAAAVFIGLADIAVAVMARRGPKVGDVLIDAAFIALGAVMIWLVLMGIAGKQIDLGPVLNKYSGWLLLLFGMGAFVLRTAMSIREGLAKLKEAGLSEFTIWKSRYQVFSGVIFIVFIAVILVALLSHSPK